MVVLAGDLKGHVWSSNVGFDGTHGGFWYRDRNADGSSILEFADGLNLVICNTLFMKQESQLVTYAAGPIKSTIDYIDYIIVWQEDKAKVCNVKVIPGEECVSNGIRSVNQECVYGSLRKRREEYKSMVKGNVTEAEWKYLDVHEHWQQMLRKEDNDWGEEMYGVWGGGCHAKR